MSDFARTPDDRMDASGGFVAGFTARHALADSTEVDVTVSADRLELRVADDGNGVGRLPEDGGLSYVHRLVARAGARIEREAGVGTNWRIDLR